MKKIYQLDAYDYDLPEERIAQHPSAVPGSSRLLALMLNASGQYCHRDAKFKDICELLPQNALLVANNARVLPGRISTTSHGGGKEEFLLLSPLPEILENAKNCCGIFSANVECLLRPARRYQLNESYQLCENLDIQILEKRDFGRHYVKLTWKGNLEEMLFQNGKLPLPPYIRRDNEPEDAARYQTCYASQTGALAAPTAGLHFTPAIRQNLVARGIEWRELTLYVGYGTFSPIRCEDIRKHEMHSELMEINQETASAINKAKASGRPVIAVGTTSLRALESACNESGKLAAGKKWTDIFIFPGYEFKMADALITNFHLPKSSLLLLVSAFAGAETVMQAYKYAISQKYNFFSYGDAMYIQRKA